MFKKPGRPRALDELKRRDVCTLIAAGCGLPEAARYVGCSVSTLRREIAASEHFREHLRAAERDAQLETLRAMRRAASTHWRAAAWMLERTHPHRFGRQYVQANIEDQLAVVIDEMVHAAAGEIPDQPTRNRVATVLHAAARHAARSLRNPSQRPPQSIDKEPAKHDDDPVAEVLAMMDKDWNERRAARLAADCNNSQNSSNSGAKTK